MSAKNKSESSSASSSRGLAILGGGNLGQALARGLVRSSILRPDQIHVTSLHLPGLVGLAEDGHPTGSDNLAAIGACDTVLIAVQPQQIVDLIDEIRLVPVGGELAIELHGDLAAIFGLSSKDPRYGASRAQITLVAGARNCLDLLLRADRLAAIG